SRERDAFGRKIADFGLIKEKLGEMVAQIYALESMSYRITGMIDSMLKGIDRGGAAAPKQTLEALQEYAVECSILKVMGTEILGFVADEAVQIFGGYGFCSGYNVERAYRDCRVNRIFEGTNEINRLLITDMLMKRSLKGQLPLLAAARKLTDEILGMAPLEETEDGDPLAAEARLVQGARKVALLVAGSAVQRYMLGLEHEQEVIGVMSNLVMAIFAMESALLRAQKRLARGGSPESDPAVAAMRVYLYDAADRMETGARRALARIAEGDTLRTHLSVLRRFLRRTPPDTIELRRQLAGRAVEMCRYPFE
ncbi:MAG TPA: acyl-CoA dehydrogenase family protein, partial [Terriglobia bacterium]|nr:acyl-CoA dehydrogenase family protein [Terriglobia bacterium]